MDKYNLVLTSASGVEGVTKKELTKLGVRDPKAVEGSFYTVGSALDVARLNMFLRTAERVYIMVGRFTATTFDELFDGIQAIPWEDYLSPDGEFIVNGKSKKSHLFAVSSCQSIIKKGIITRLSKSLKKTSFDENGERYGIEFSLNNDEITVLLNTSGAGLHKRGYRDLVGEAPLKETLACALLYLAGFDGERAFVDPFCGSGTIVTEGARMALNIAAGKDRNFDYQGWKSFDKSVYNTALDEALQTETLDKKIRMSGFDIDPAAIKLSMHHALNAGVKDYVHLQTQDVAMLKSRYRNGIIVTNPPYGERLLDLNSAYALYKTMGEVFRALDDWSINVITSAPLFEKYYGQRADKNRKLYNSQKECKLYSYLPKQMK